MKINLLLLFCLSTMGLSAQMTVIYESGNGTTNSILDDFTIDILSNSPIRPPRIVTNGYAVDYTFLLPGFDNMEFYLSNRIDDMHLYRNLEFYIEYQLNDSSTNKLSLYSTNYDDVDLTKANIISSNALSSIKIPFTNTNLDSILLIKFDPLVSDSIFLRINYISVSADLSSTVSVDKFDTIEKDFLVYANDSQIQVLNKGTKAYKVNVFSLTGQNVFSEKSDESLQINLNHPSGIYIVQIMRDGQYYSQKVFLNN